MYRECHMHTGYLLTRLKEVALFWITKDYMPAEVTKLGLHQQHTFFFFYRLSAHIILKVLGKDLVLKLQWLNNYSLWMNEKPCYLYINCLLFIKWSALKHILHCYLIVFFCCNNGVGGFISVNILFIRSGAKWGIWFIDLIHLH